MATLHLVCGKIAAGKSTLTAELAAQPRTVLISEDFWTARLFLTYSNAFDTDLCLCRSVSRGSSRCSRCVPGLPITRGWRSRPARCSIDNGRLAGCSE